MPGKFATMNPIAPPLRPPTTLQNLPVAFPPCSARPSSLNISSNTSPNCSFPNLFSSSGFWALELNPKLDHGKLNPEVVPGAGLGISSSESKDVEAVEAPEPNP